LLGGDGMGKRRKWTDEDIIYLKENYQTMTRYVLSEKLDRTPKAIAGKVNVIGLTKINTTKTISIVKNNKKYKTCITCGKLLPETESYFQVDTSCRNALRNSCRMCKGERYGAKKIIIWTDEMNNFMVENYGNKLDSEIAELINEKFNICASKSSIQNKAHSLGLLKSSTIKRHILDNSEARKRSHVNRSNCLTSSKKWMGSDNPFYNSERFGKDNPNYKGGKDKISKEIRRHILDWKVQSFISNGRKCVISGGVAEVVHHVVSLNKIMDEVFAEMGIDRKRSLTEYDIELEKEIINKTKNKHIKYGLGKPLTKYIHELFHSIYGYGDNTIEQWDEFELNLKE
jgi:hypothetical protein